MATEKIIFEFDVKGADAALKEATELNKKIRDNKETIKELSKEYDKNAEKITLLTQQNKELATSQRNLAKTATAVEGSYDSLSAEMARLKKEQKQVNVMTKEGQARYEKMGKDINKLNTKLKSLDETNGVHTRNVGHYQLALKDAAGQLNIMGVNVGQVTTQFTQASRAVQATTGAIGGSTKALKIFKVALLSTGIGAVVLALGSLVTYLTTTQSGIDKLNTVLRPLGAIFDRLLGLIQQLGESLFNAFSNPLDTLKDLGNFLANQIIVRFRSFGVLAQSIAALFKGDFSKSARLAKKGLSEFATGIEDADTKLGSFVENIKESVSEAAALGTAIDRMKKSYEEFEIFVVRRSAELKRIFNEQKGLSDDINLSLEQKLAASRNAQAAIEEMTNLEIQRLQRQLDIRLEEQKLNDTSREELLENARLEAQIQEAKAQQAKRINEVRNRELTLLKELNAELKKEQEIVFNTNKQKEETVKAQNDEIIAVQTTGEAVEQLTEKEVKRLNNLLKLQKVAENANAITTTGLESAIELTQIYSQFQQAAMNRELAAAGENAEKRLEIEKKYARRQKQVAITQSILNGALAITKTMANLGAPAGFIASAIVAAQTAAQIALISSQQFAKGGLTEGGMFEGASHAQGGVKFKVGGRIHEAEGGEAIINKRSTLMFKPILSAINQAGGGKKFETGGLTSFIPSMSGIMNKQLESEQLKAIEMAMMQQKTVLQIPVTTAMQNGINTVEVNSTL